MVEGILRYLARALASILERFADPELDAKLRAFNERVAQADARAKDAEQEFEAAETNRRAWEQQTLESIAKQAALRTQFEASEKAITVLEDEIVSIQKKTQELNATVRSRSDDDVFSHAPRTDL